MTFDQICEAITLAKQTRPEEIGLQIGRNMARRRKFVGTVVHAELVVALRILHKHGYGTYISDGAERERTRIVTSLADAGGTS